MTARLSRYALVFLTVLLFWNTLGCDEERDNAEERRGSRTTSQEKIVVALVPEENVFEQRRRYKYITDYLSKRMGLEVRLDILANYDQICGAFAEGRADAGFLGSFSYVLTRYNVGIEPIARPVWKKGTSSYRAYIIARKDSGIQVVDDMQGKTMVLVDKATTAGYLFPRYYLNYYGIERLEDYFSKIYFAGTHDAAAWATFTGEADVGGCKDEAFLHLAEVYPEFKKQMVVLAESPEEPSNGFAVRKDLNLALKLRLGELLLNLHESEEGRSVLEKFGARKFIDTRDEDYAPVHKMAQKLNIDLASYPCKD